MLAIALAPLQNRALASYTSGAIDESRCRDEARWPATAAHPVSAITIPAYLSALYLPTKERHVSTPCIATCPDPASPRHQL